MSSDEDDILDEIPVYGDDAGSCEGERIMEKDAFDSSETYDLTSPEDRKDLVQAIHSRAKTDGYSHEAADEVVQRLAESADPGGIYNQGKEISLKVTGEDMNEGYGDLSMVGIFENGEPDPVNEWDWGGS